MPAFGLAFFMVELPAAGRAAAARRTTPPLNPPPLEPPPEEDEEEPFLEALSLLSFLYLARNFLFTRSQKISRGTIAKGVNILQATIKFVHAPGSAT